MVESAANSLCLAPGDRVAVLLALPLGRTYDYRVADGMALRPGDFVRVPLGHRTAVGVVWGPSVGDVAAEKIKDVLERLDVPIMPDIQRRFIDWVAAYTLSAPGAVLKMAMSVPDALTPPKPVIAYSLSSGTPDIKITPARQRVMDVLGNGPPRGKTELARDAGVGVSVVGGLVKAGALATVELAPVDDTPQPDWNCPGPELSKQQSVAADSLVQAVDGGGYGVTLL
ncbi:MAG: primosomal protein N', partial [Alphaproteobacteria bacterium]